MHHRYAFAALSLCVLLTAQLPLSAQDLQLQAKWKKGDTRTLYITGTDRITDNAEVISEQQTKLNVKVRVADVRPEAYWLDVEYRNPILHQAREMSDKLGTDLDPWRNLVLRYTVDRATGDMDLFNWEEAREAMRTTLDQAKRTLRKSDPPMADALAAVLQPTLDELNTKQQVVALFQDHIEFLGRGIGKPLNTGEPLRVATRQADPFRVAGDSVDVAYVYHLDGLDKETGRATLRVEEITDADQLKARMQEMMMLTMEALTDRAAKADLKERMAGMELAIEREETHTVDISTAWPLRMARTGQVTARMQGKESITTQQLSIEVR